MTRWSSMLLAVVLLALMGLARLPVPCVGDGQGHPCSMEHCACTAACSCKAACQEMQQYNNSPAAASGDRHAHCHMANMAHSAPMACGMTMPDHSPPKPGHFAPPGSPAPFLMGQGVRPRRLASSWTPHEIEAPSVFASLILAPPEPPPRVSG